LKINLEVTPYIENEIKLTDTYTYSKYNPLTTFKQSIVLIPDYEKLLSTDAHAQESTIDYNKAIVSYDKVNRIGFYTHGRAGIYDEINYTDSIENNEIKPTL
jgi:hypothetical protein